MELCGLVCWISQPKTVQTVTIAKSCTILGQSLRVKILEWGLVNLEKIEEFLKRMISNLFFRNYYFGIYNSLRLLHLSIFYCPAIGVSKAEKKWSSKLDNVLEEEQRTLERSLLEELWASILNRLKLMIKEIGTCGDLSYLCSLPGRRRSGSTLERGSGVT